MEQAMYRDNLEALRQRIRELNHALAELPPEPPAEPIPWERIKSIVICLGMGLFFLGAGIDRVFEASQMRAQFRAHQAAVSSALYRPAATVAPTQLSARVVAGGVGDCTISLTPPCHATIACNGGKILYRGSGTCAGGRYLDPADSWLDGTPQCAIDLDRKRAMVREIECHRSGRDRFAKRWQVDLELE
jgi:hypothetical protein